MQVQFGNNRDIDEWMKLVEEISWNFPGLESKEKIDEHRETVLLSTRLACLQYKNHIG